jgi:hypothetical protein
MAEKKKEEGARSFARFLEEVCDGMVHTEVSAKLHELVQQLEKEAENRGKSAGKITLTLSFKLDASGKADIAYDVTTKEPKPERGTGVAWLTPGSNFTFTNPRQQRLPLHDVNTSARLADDTTEGEPRGRVVADI